MSLFALSVTHLRFSRQHLGSAALGKAIKNTGYTVFVLFVFVSVLFYLGPFTIGRFKWQQILFSLSGRVNNFYFLCVSDNTSRPTALIVIQ